MRIYGLDFTSAPGRKKPITCVECELEKGVLRVSGLEQLTSFDQFETFLSREGPWVAGIDFPFGQPRKPVQNLAWPQSWAEYVEKIFSMMIEGFEQTLKKYRERRPKGDKQHLRETDQKSHSRSPMMMYGVPVGRMFFQGAPRLLKSGASILPCRPNDDNRIVVEAYPALVARRWTRERRPYKNDKTSKQTPENERARQGIVSGLHSPDLREHHGFALELTDSMRARFVKDPTGDTLDALLCAVQAAWASLQKDRTYGIPSTCHSLEGWIVDPFDDQRR